ncbi:hypothetical protein, partial [Antarctobacter heliothermus]
MTKPIFLHAVNAELHLALGKPVDQIQLLSSIRAFSLVSSSRMFCNISQIHEVFFDNPEALSELRSLYECDRFVAHSDYGQFEEFRESRANHFRHTLAQHPGFKSAPLQELRDLPLGSMGQSMSMTSFIENRLEDIVEERSLESGLITPTARDTEILRRNADWVEKTLRMRDQKALTFETFDRVAGHAYDARDEGVLRRALTEAYVTGYMRDYDADCIWGYVGLEHVERFPLLSSLSLRLALEVALLRKGWLRDSSRESSVVAVLHEQTDPAEL